MQCYLTTWTNHEAQRRRGGQRRRMGLVDAPLGKDLFDGLGEHLGEAGEHPGRAYARATLGEHLLGGQGQRTLGKHLLGG